MATVDWALTCDFAYFDPTGRLCLIGADANRVRTLASGNHRLSLVAHLADACDDRLDPVLGVRSPDGACRIASESIDFTRERRGNCVLFHLPRVPLTELGRYRFELALGAAEPTMLELSVDVREHSRPRVHLHGAY
jgi:hypothetical protein